MKSKKYVIWPAEQDTPIEAGSKAHAEYLYSIYEHASMELWNINEGTARTIKQK